MSRPISTMAMDNYGTHKASKVEAWLARHPRYHVHSTPTSGSWLNGGTIVRGSDGRICPSWKPYGSSSTGKAMLNYLDQLNRDFKPSCGPRMQTSSLLSRTTMRGTPPQSGSRSRAVAETSVDVSSAGFTCSAVGPIRWDDVSGPSTVADTALRPVLPMAAVPKPPGRRTAIPAARK